MTSDFKTIADLAKSSSLTIVSYLCPHGKREGHEWVALNPTRSDTKPGSFKINLKTGKWADFSTGDRGGDLISLWAYIKGIGQYEAMKELKTVLGRF
jgi:putative DNA primase/helicase